MENNKTILKPNFQYKDRLFKAIFNNKKYLLMLYNAINDTNHDNPNDIDMVIIEGVIYITMKNDVSFIIDNQLHLYEQQSTYNPNMPLRGLMYFTQAFQMYITKHKLNIYGKTPIKIPTPNFIVLYNGVENVPDKLLLKLSDLFMIPDKTKGFE